ncbi:hypothetical protein BDF20DRAFT_788414, partial [Mycotypha africana]|uniref:uncharacterized protein n=1 Tax=Mycotypha africana TaxID=64632 RepID=UPI002300CCF6
IVPLYDLQHIIQQYQSQPELLKLILTSKVEEDKRRAEEAKLRAKELDIYLQQIQPPNHNRMATAADAEDHQKRRESAAVAMLAMGGNRVKEN